MVALPWWQYPGVITPLSTARLHCHLFSSGKKEKRKKVCGGVCRFHMDVRKDGTRSMFQHLFFDLSIHRKKGVKVNQVFNVLLCRLTAFMFVLCFLFSRLVSTFFLKGAANHQDGT